MTAALSLVKRRVNRIAVRNAAPYLAATLLGAAGLGLYTVNETAGLFAGVTVMLVGFLVML
ncbi:hypothetical protein [Methylobacterium oryzihabitans]|uniref:Uncharacterized protein n=1 Tax=Methylobacterium oryzihabitans TaxID=2499852 RepID=A0A3S2VQ66_9HYPH|nr:hypothetical protein [Methylobacterium oryzihabitans]RVU14404.1 hypothetical protein EOE48_23560 [Methylobacterium oryzihabitans]